MTKLSDVTLFGNLNNDEHNYRYVVCVCVCMGGGGGNVFTDVCHSVQ